MRGPIVVLGLALLLVAGQGPASATPQAGVDEADRLYRLGALLQQQGRLPDAVEAFREAIRQDPTRADAYAQLREAYSQGRTVEDLVGDLRQTVARDADDFISWNLLGILYAKRGRWSEARDALERAVALEPRDIDAWTNLGWLASEFKQLERAREAFSKALVLDPQYGRAHAGVAGVYVEAEGDYDKAIAAYRLALAVEPDNAAYLYDMGWAHYRKGSTDEALEILLRASALNPNDAAGRAKLGFTRLRRNEHDAAIEEFRRALQLEPTYAFARFGLGRALQARGDSDGALAAYKEAWQESRNDLYLIYLLNLYLQRSLWIVVVAVVLTMAGALVWLFRRASVTERSTPAPPPR
jgi:tetratricopeptide (TPR) repeat protein